jgi:hypothetical protein
MNRLHLLFYGLLISSGLSAQQHSPDSQYHIYVRMSMTDCLNCYGALPFIRQIPPTLPVKWVMKEIYRKDGQAILEEQLGFADSKNHILFSDSLFDALAQGPEARIILAISRPGRGDSLIESIPLRELPQHIFQLSARAPLSVAYSESSLAGDSLILTEQAQGMTAQHALGIFDYMQNVLIIKYLDKNRKDYLCYGADFPRQEWLRRVLGNDEAYEATRQLDPLLKAFRKDRCQIESVFCDADTAFMTVSLPYVPESRKRAPDDPLAISILFFLVKVPMRNPEQIQVAQIETKGLGVYDIDVSLMYMRGPNCYLGIFKSDLEAPAHFIASFRPKRGQYVLNQKELPTLPPLFMQNGWVYDYNSFAACGNRLLLHAFPWIWEAAQGQWLPIPIESRADSLSGYELLACVEQGSDLCLLYKEGKRWYLGFWEAGRLMRKHEIELPPAVSSRLKGVPFFIGPHQLAAVNEDNRLTIIYLYKQPMP